MDKIYALDYQCRFLCSDVETLQRKLATLCTRAPSHQNTDIQNFNMSEAIDGIRKEVSSCLKDKAAINTSNKVRTHTIHFLTY